MKNNQIALVKLKKIIDNNCYWLLLLLPTVMMISFVIYTLNIDRAWVELEYLKNVIASDEDKLRFAQYTLQCSFAFSWFKLMSEPLIYLLLEITILLISVFSLSILFNLNISLRQAIGDVVLLKTPYLLITMIISIKLLLLPAPFRLMPESLTPLSLSNLFFKVEANNFLFSLFSNTDLSIILGSFVYIVFIHKTTKISWLLSSLMAVSLIVILVSSRFIVI